MCSGGECCGQWDPTGKWNRCPRVQSVNPRVCGSQSTVEISARSLENMGRKLERSRPFAIWGKACDLGWKPLVLRKLWANRTEAGCVKSQSSPSVEEKAPKSWEFWNCLSKFLAWPLLSQHHSTSQMVNMFYLLANTLTGFLSLFYS